MVCHTAVGTHFIYTLVHCTYAVYVVSCDCHMVPKVEVTVVTQGGGRGLGVGGNRVKETRDQGVWSVTLDVEERLEKQETM